MWFQLILLIVTGLQDIRTFAKDSVNETEENDIFIPNLSANNESIQNSSTLPASIPEEKSRILHKFNYSNKKKAPHETLNSDSQNRSFERDFSPLKNVDKINFRKKQTLQNSGWIYNNKFSAQGKRGTHEETKKSSSSEIQANEDYYQHQQHQLQRYQLPIKSSGPEYTDSYNTDTSNAYIDDYKDYENLAEEKDVQNWPNSYYPAADGAVSYDCSCYKKPSSYDASMKQNYDNPTSTFMQTLGTMSTNLWQLIQIMATNAIPFMIPIIIFKLILVPIKIFKILQLIKLIFKLLIVLPFVIRVLYPAISNGLGIQNWFYSFAHPDHRYDQSENREEINTSVSWHKDLEHYTQQYSNFVNDTLLRSCPSKAACEIGSLLSTSTKTKFPEKLSKYLVEKAELAEETEKVNKKGDSLELEKESAFSAFIIALGKKWSIEQCAVYTCTIVL